MSLTRSELLDLAARGESEVQEFKTRTSAGARREAAQTLCGMSNARGGRVMFGIEPSGTVAGQIVSDHTVEQVAAEFARIEPAVYPEIERVALGQAGAEVLVVSVGRSGGSMALHAIAETLGPSVEPRSVQTDLQLLRNLELVSTAGWGRGARWQLRNGTTVE